MQLLKKTLKSDDCLAYAHARMICTTVYRPSKLNVNFIMVPSLIIMLLGDTDLHKYTNKKIDHKFIPTRIQWQWYKQNKTNKATKNH